MENNVIFPTVLVEGAKKPVILIQGGMGVGISRPRLVMAVARERPGGRAIGTLSSAALNFIHQKETGKKIGIREAVKREILTAKSDGGFIAINCMVAVAEPYEKTIFGVLDAKGDAIVSGAGLPNSLPGVVIQYKKEYGLDYHVALIPIISSARALKIICKLWWKRYQRIPDAVILEGPEAGGHLGFSYEKITAEENRLENLFPAVKEFAQANGDFPVIVAGGIFYREDILFWINEMEADGVQIASRFAVTVESSSSDEFKSAIIKARAGDIIIAEDPCSPCGLPFRIISSSSGYIQALNNRRPPKCNKGIVLQKDGQGNYTVCPAKKEAVAGKVCSFCICNVLLAATNLGELGEWPIFSIGSRGHLIDKILSVDELMIELLGH